MRISAVPEKPIPKLFEVLVYTYLFVYYTRIQDNIPGLAVVPWVGALFLIVTLIGLIQLKGKFFTNEISLVFWLGILFAISGIGAISTVAYQYSFKWITQSFTQCVAVYVVFCNKEGLKKLMDWWCLIYFVVALFSLKNSPFGPGDFIGDPNDVSIALAMGIPYVLYSSFQIGISKFRKMFCYGTIALMVLAFVLSGSRGGFLGFLAMLGVVWTLSAARLKIMLYSTLLAVVFGAAVYSSLPSGYLDDMQSINDVEDGTRVERIRTWELGWEMFKAHPIVGIGAGNFPNTSHLYHDKTSWWTGEQKSLSGRAAHSLYFQVLPELGILGAGIFLYVIFVMPLKLWRRSKKLNKDDPIEFHQKLFCNALLASMAAFAVAGAFISVAYYPHIFIWLTMYAIVSEQMKDKG